MSKHRNGPHTNQPPTEKHAGREIPVRVSVEPGVKIDFVDDVKKEDKARYGESTDYQKRQLRWTKIAAGLVLAYTLVMVWQGYLTKKIISETGDQISLSKDQFAASHRPWVKISHHIVQPLTFNAPAWQGPVAKLILQDRIENVGETVATDVFGWEDVIPLDSDESYRSALARRSEWCDANRHPNSSLTGDLLFPKDPITRDSSMGPAMGKVFQAASRNKDGLVGFAVVGCVCYRSTLEPKSNPTHQTRFLYFLGKVTPDGGFNPMIKPYGIGNDLQLVQMPDAWSAD